MINQNSKILVTGGSGFLGKYVVQKLGFEGFSNVLSLSSKQTDLRRENMVKELFCYYQPDAVIHLAATVGGIGANMKNPGIYFYDNMIMGLNVIENSRIFNVKKFVQVGTVCSYPKFCSVPFKEKDIWSGYPEETNAPYGIAKKSLYVMLDSYRKQYNFNSTILVPCNLYGPYDNFNPDSSHVIPAIIKKMVEAVNKQMKKVICWGSGNATREFLYAEDAANAIVKSLMIDTDSDPINLGNNQEISIKNLTEMISSIVGYDYDIEWDISKPDGQPRRCLDITKAKNILEWKATTSLQDGLKKTIDWYLGSF